MILKDLANYAQQFASLLIVLLGVLFFHKRTLPIKILAIYGLNSFMFQTAGNLIVHYKIKGVININGNIYVLTELLLLLLFFFALFDSNLFKRVIIGFALVGSVLYFIFIQGQWTVFNGAVRTLRDITIIICSLMYFYFLLSNIPSVSLSKYPMFWINTGLLLLFAGTFTLSLTTDFWATVLETTDSFWIARNFYRFFCCLMICYGLLLDAKQTKVELATK
jgi:hypothetical protein